MRCTRDGNERAKGLVPYLNKKHLLEKTRNIHCLVVQYDGAVTSVVKRDMPKKTMKEQKAMVRRKSMRPSLHVEPEAPEKI
jgi:hypothetical protein